MEHKLAQEEFLRLTFAGILKRSPDMIFVKDMDLRYVVASQSFADLVGADGPEALVGKTDYDVFEGALARRYIEDDRKVLESGQPFPNYIEPLPERDGQRRYSSTSKCPLVDDSGAVVGLYGVARDVTAQIELEEEREFRTLSHQLFEGVLEADVTEDRMLRAAGTTWGDRLELLSVERFSDAVVAMAERTIHPGYAMEFQGFYRLEKLRVDFARGIHEFSHITYQTDDGEHYKWIEFRSRLYSSHVSGTLRLVTFLKDLDSEIKAREQLKQRAETDPLTGLLNRESALHQISDCIGGYGARKTHALLFIDLDYFKQVNDTMGHRTGDLLLQEVAGVLKSAFRQSDIVGRIGGDEFLVLLKNVDSEEDAECKAREVFARIPHCRVGAGGTQHVTCSVGVTLYRGSGVPLEQLIEEADRAMYRAKEQGRNCISFF